MKYLAPSLFALCLAAPAGAADLYGTLTATIGGEDRTWSVNGDANGSQSDWTLMTRGLYDVSFWGNTDPDQTASVTGALLIDFSLIQASGGAADATVQYLEEGYTAYWYAEGDAVTLTFTAIEPSDTALHLAGTFTATAGKIGKGGVPDDAAGELPISGSFDVTLPATE